MRLNNYLTEIKDTPLKLALTTEEGVDELVAMIKRDCAPFLKECGGRLAYRKMNKEGAVGIKDVRKRRKPRDTSIILHSIMNKWFKGKFGWNVRSEGLFCNGIKAIEFGGDAVVIFPIGNIQYVWSDKTDDLYQEVDVHSEDDKVDRNIEEYTIKANTTTEIIRTIIYNIKDKVPSDSDKKMATDFIYYVLNKLDFSNKELSRALQTRVGDPVEVAIKCDKFYYIDADRVGEVSKKLGMKG